MRHCLHHTAETRDGAACCGRGRPEGQSGTLDNIYTNFTNAEANYGRSIVSLLKAKVLNKRTQLCHPSYSRRPPPLYALVCIPCVMHLQNAPSTQMAQLFAAFFTPSLCRMYRTTWKTPPIYPRSRKDPHFPHWVGWGVNFVSR